MDYNTLVLEQIQLLLEQHRLKSVIYNGWILVNGGLPGIRAFVSDIRQYENACSVRLDVEILLEKNKIMTESFGDSGKDEVNAIGNALMNFCQSSLHVLLAAFWDCIYEEQLTVEEWKLKKPEWNFLDLNWSIFCSKWKVFTGNFVRKSYTGKEIPIPDDTFPVLEELVKALTLKNNIHWVRFYYCNVDYKDRVAEVLLDNKTWKKAQGRMLALPWPESDYFYSVRNFMILKKT